MGKQKHIKNVKRDKSKKNVKHYISTACSASMTVEAVCCANVAYLLGRRFAVLEIADNCHEL